MDLSYSHVCSSVEDVPSDAAERIEPLILERLGGSFSELFPDFSGVFPNAASSFEQYWSVPKLVLQQGVRRWLSAVVVQTETENTFFTLNPTFKAKVGDEFDSQHENLHVAWHELYRWFDSFDVTQQTEPQIDWLNTPFGHSSRLDLREVVSVLSEERISKVSRASIVSFGAACSDYALDADELDFWLVTEGGDLVFSNSQGGGGKMYHVNHQDFGDVVELTDPRSALDDYLSIYLGPGRDSLTNANSSPFRKALG